MLIIVLQKTFEYFSSISYITSQGFNLKLIIWYIIYLTTKRETITHNSLNIYEQACAIMIRFYIVYPLT